MKWTSVGFAKSKWSTRIIAILFSCQSFDREIIDTNYQEGLARAFVLNSNGANESTYRFSDPAWSHEESGVLQADFVVVVVGVVVGRGGEVVIVAAAATAAARCDPPKQVINRNAGFWSHKIRLANKPDEQMVLFQIAQDRYWAGTLAKQSWVAEVSSNFSNLADFFATSPIH